MRRRSSVTFFAENFAKIAGLPILGSDILDKAYTSNRAVHMDIDDEDDDIEEVEWKYASIKFMKNTLKYPNFLNKMTVQN